MRRRLYWPTVVNTVEQTAPVCCSHSLGAMGPHPDAFSLMLCVPLPPSSAHADAEAEAADDEAPY